MPRISAIPAPGFQSGFLDRRNPAAVDPRDLDGPLRLGAVDAEFPDGGVDALIWASSVVRLG